MFELKKKVSNVGLQNNNSVTIEKKRIIKKCNLNVNYVQLNQNFHVVGQNKNYRKLKFLRQLIEIIKVLPTSSTVMMSITLSFHE